MVWSHYTSGKYFQLYNLLLILLIRVKCQGECVQRQLWQRSSSSILFSQWSTMDVTLDWRLLLHQMRPNGAETGRTKLVYVPTAAMAFDSTSSKSRGEQRSSPPFSIDTTFAYMQIHMTAYIFLYISFSTDDELNMITNRGSEVLRELMIWMLL